VTEPGARALACGLGQSKLESFTINHSIRERPAGESARIWQILYQGLHASQIRELTFAPIPMEEIVGLGDILPGMPLLRVLV